MEPLISQVLLIGDRLPFLTALFTLNTAAAEDAQGHGRVESAVPQKIIAGAAGAGGNSEGGGAREQAVGAVRAGPQVPHPAARVFHRAGRADRDHESAARTRAMENFKEQIDELYAGRE